VNSRLSMRRLARPLQKHTCQAACNCTHYPWARARPVSASVRLYPRPASATLLRHQTARNVAVRLDFKGAAVHICVFGERHLPCLVSRPVLGNAAPTADAENPPLTTPAWPLKRIFSSLTARDSARLLKRRRHAGPAGAQCGGRGSPTTPSTACHCLEAEGGWDSVLFWAGVVVLGVPVPERSTPDLARSQCVLSSSPTSSTPVQPCVTCVFTRG
jgi:hypothetical protein